jgi:hypothetical protein
VAALGLALVAGLVAFNWTTVRDHAEAWWFQATQGTETIVSDPGYVEHYKKRDGYAFQAPKDLLHFLASVSGTPVVATREALKEHVITGEHDPTIVLSYESVPSPLLQADSPFLLEAILGALQAIGHRVIEQRFPCRAYVVVGYAQGTFATIPLGGPINQ